MVDPNGQWGFSIKSVVNSVKSAATRAASTVKSIVKSVSPKATISKVIQSGSKVAANIKANVSKVTAKVLRGIQSAVKTVKNLTNPKTIREKTRAVVQGVKATVSSIKKTVSGAVSKAEKFAGTAKLGLLAASKTAKGAMVKYAVPAANRVVSGVKQTVTTGAKFTKGAVLGLFDAGKSTITGISSIVRHPIQTYQGLKTVVTNPRQTLQAIKTGAVNVARAFASGDAETRGKIIGRAVGEVALAFVGTKGVDKIAKVAKGSRLVAELGNAAKASRAGQMLGRAGGQFRSIAGRLIAEETGSFDPFFGLGRKGTGKTTILGENMRDRVIPFAEKTNARTLPWGTMPEKWAKMTPKERWKLNDGLLRARINEGDNFRYIGTDLNRLPADRTRFDLIRSELLRLEERGIPYDTVSKEEVFRTIGRP